MHLLHSSCTGWVYPVENKLGRKLFMRLHTIPLTSHVHFKQCRFYSAVLLKIQHVGGCVLVEIISLNKWHFARTAIDIWLITAQSIMRSSLLKGGIPPRVLHRPSWMPITCQKKKNNKETNFIFKQIPGLFKFPI